MPKRWTEEENQYLRDNYPKVDIQTLADSLGVKLIEVQDRLAKLELTGAEEEAPDELDTESLDKQSKRFSAARAEFERGVKALRAKNYDKAREHFDNIVEKYPKEREIADRARIYISVCDRQQSPRKPDLSGPGDYYYAATLEKNRGNFAQSLDYLRRAQKQGDDDKVEYLMASACALSGDSKNAMVHLEKAISGNGLNRVQAGIDGDFECLRADRSFRRLVYREI